MPTSVKTFTCAISINKITNWSWGMMIKNFVTMTYNQFVTAGTAKGASYVGTYYDSSKFVGADAKAIQESGTCLAITVKKERNTARDVNQGIDDSAFWPRKLYLFI